MRVEGKKSGSTASRRSGWRSPKQWATLALLAAGLACLFFMLQIVVAHPVGTLDFVNFYTAGTILKQGSPKDLYNLPLQREIERRLAPAGLFQPFIHPPFEACLYAPLAHLRFAHAFLLWAGVNLLLLALVFYFLPRTGRHLDPDSRLVWLAACFPIVGGVLVLGQDSLLLAPIFLFAFLALKKRYDGVAGLVLGAGLIRFEIMLPFVFIFLLRRRWRVLVGFSAASVVALLASAAMVGWGGLVNYGKLLVEAGQTAGNQAFGVVTAAMPSLRGAITTFLGGVIPFPLLFPLILAGTLALLGWGAWQFKSIVSPGAPGFDLEFSLAALAALLASYHLFVHELTPLIVVGFLILGYEDTAQRRESLLKRRGASLLLLFSLVLIVGEVLRFRGFSVIFIVLLGLMIWLSQETTALAKQAPSR
jgi:Glycosyltransferase family 87